jgi:hypothetical protein
MRCKTLTAAAVVMLMMTAGCSTLERVVYRPDINQGNYLVANDVAKIHTLHPRYADDERPVWQQRMVLRFPSGARS